MIEIKQCTPDEAGLICEFSKRLLVDLGDSPENISMDPFLLKGWIQKSEYFGFYAIDHDQEPAGIITIAPMKAAFLNSEIGVIQELYIAPQYQSKGVGAALIESAITLARSMGWPLIEVSSSYRAEPERRVKFYERNGFTQIATRLKLSL